MKHLNNPAIRSSEAMINIVVFAFCLLCTQTAVAAAKASPIVQLKNSYQARLLELDFQQLGSSEFYFKDRWLLRQEANGFVTIYVSALDPGLRLLGWRLIPTSKNDREASIQMLDEGLAPRWTYAPTLEIGSSQPTSWVVVNLDPTHKRERTQEIC